MLLFSLWTMLVLGALTGAGYSHYRYRVRNNQYYERLFAGSREATTGVEIERYAGSRLLPVLTLIIVTLLVPVSLVI